MLSYPSSCTLQKSTALCVQPFITWGCWLDFEEVLCCQPPLNFITPPTTDSVTCSVEVYERLAVEVVVQTLAAVLLQLNLLDADRFPNHLILLFPSEEAVSQCAIHRNGPPLLSDLVASLKFRHKSTWYEKIKVQRNNKREGWGENEGLQPKRLWFICTLNPISVFTFNFLLLKWEKI